MAKENLIESKVLSSIDVAGLNINFQRTCRVPEGRINSLPAGLGSFPLYKVDDFKSGCPKDWSGYFMPMYIQEAMWINFGRNYHANPNAVIIGAGSINAVTGKQMNKKGKEFEMELEKQNYLVVPPQPWIDGWKDKDGKIYQFVAAHMGSGETVEGQITGEEKFGGIQIGVFSPKPDAKITKATRPMEYIVGGGWDFFASELGEADNLLSCCIEKSFSPSNLKVSMFASAPEASYKSCLDEGSPMKGLRSIQAMGLGRGGEIEQKIYDDPYGLKVWQSKPVERTYIYMVNDESFKQITGQKAPPTPVTYEKYQQFGLPWFELHDKKLEDVAGSDVFGKLKTVAGKKGKKTKL